MFAIHVLYRLFFTLFVRFILGCAIFHFKLSLTHLRGRTNQLKTWHADPGRSRPGFSKIYTPNNLLPQQNVREEAIVYCQSINNLDCWHKTDWSVKCLTIPHLKFCTRICSFVRGRETSLCFTYNHIMCFRLKDDKWIIPSVEVDCLNGECLKWQINYFLQILSDALGHIKT